MCPYRCLGLDCAGKGGTYCQCWASSWHSTNKFSRQFFSQVPTFSKSWARCNDLDKNTPRFCTCHSQGACCWLDIVAVWGMIKRTRRRHLHLLMYCSFYKGRLERLQRNLTGSYESFQKLEKVYSCIKPSNRASHLMINFPRRPNRVILLLFLLLLLFPPLDLCFNFFAGTQLNNRFEVL